MTHVHVVSLCVVGYQTINQLFTHPSVPTAPGHTEHTGHTHIHTYTHTYIHTYIHTYRTYIHIHTHTHTYIHTYRTYTYTHTHTYIHTYLHDYIGGTEFSQPLPFVNLVTFELEYLTQVSVPSSLMTMIF